MDNNTTKINIDTLGQTTVLGITVIGKLQHKDYQVINRELAKAPAGNTLNAWVDLTQMEGFTLHALWDDLTLGIKHWSDFKKIAIIGDKQWQAATDVAGKLSHIEFQSCSDNATAKAWVENTQ